ncbi:MAG TPA: flippase-like domain-containing protein, partial [Halococcus sp.]|nr:flippase-like domain-containing protein [Halococcus sp.]
PLALVLFLSTVLYLAAGVVVLFAGIHLDAMDTLIGRLTAVEGVPVFGTRLAELVEKLPEFTAASATSFEELSRDSGVIVRYAVGWAGTMVCAPGLRVWLLLTALGVDFEPAILLPVYLLMAYSVTLLPLTPGGIGVTEATATAVFVALGVPSAVIVPVVFVDRFLGVYLPALVGWYPSLRMDFSAFTTK